MTEVETRDMELHWDVFVTPGIPVETRKVHQKSPRWASQSLGVSSCGLLSSQRAWSSSISLNGSSRCSGVQWP